MKTKHRIARQLIVISLAVGGSSAFAEHDTDNYIDYFMNFAVFPQTDVKAKPQVGLVSIEVTSVQKGEYSEQKKLDIPAANAGMEFSEAYLNSNVCFTVISAGVHPAAGATTPSYVVVEPSTYDGKIGYVIPQIDKDGNPTVGFRINVRRHEDSNFDVWYSKGDDRWNYKYPSAKTNKKYTGLQLDWVGLEPQSVCAVGYRVAKIKSEPMAAGVREKAEVKPDGTGGSLHDYAHYYHCNVGGGVVIHCGRIPGTWTSSAERKDD